MSTLPHQKCRKFTVSMRIVLAGANSQEIMPCYHGCKHIRNYVIKNGAGKSFGTYSHAQFPLACPRLAKKREAILTARGSMGCGREEEQCSDALLHNRFQRHW